MVEREDIMRNALADMFGILEHKTRQGSLTVDDMKSILSALEAGGGVKATIRDLAGYYGKKEVDVRNVIHRNLMPKPMRRVYYDFGRFCRIVPKKWRKQPSLSED